ncbi:hypothetical protein PTTG_26461 [Puccinia triticina 1-1 BBBD Race 1]|uniref:DEAD/DEAH-box helicase domain-containing protein n=1 Tax=Puccinia triticina (isolate 1-1 / race 1 (BBBD)) TaxID=630390 RepID=A0A180GUX8_PUCT1|nr:hypothetical protein PTTG_26461 [Puccinia triticina 1-1 BBBD Race 1]
MENDHDITSVKKIAVSLPKRITGLSDELLSSYISSASKEFYHDEPKPLQVQTVSALARGENCFVRAGTGFGKTARISEMYFKLFSSQVIVLVLNPLDSLGDDQVIILVDAIPLPVQYAVCKLKGRSQVDAIGKHRVCV